jgi:hypothetical protein
VAPFRLFVASFALARSAPANSPRVITFGVPGARQFLISIREYLQGTFHLDFQIKGVGLNSGLQHSTFTVE